MIGGKMIGHRPISTSQHHPGAQRRQLRTGAIEAEQGQRGHGGRKPGKGMNLATSPQNECENRRRRPSRGLAHTPGTPIFALFRWTSERAASIRCPDGGSGQGSFASFLKGPLPPSGHRIERGTIDLQSDINCLPERSLLGAFGKQHDDYDHDVFNSAGSTLATPHFGPENGVHLKDSRLFCCGFFDYYNFYHKHSGIGLMTPADVHYGRAEQLTTARRQVLLEAHQAHPERFVRGTPQPPVLPLQAWINPPPEKTTLQDAAGATLAAWPIPGVPPFSASHNEISIEADADRADVTSLPTLIEAH